MIDMNIKVPEGVKDLELVNQKLNESIFRPVNSPDTINVRDYIIKVQSLLQKKEMDLANTKREMEVLQSMIPSYIKKKKRWTFLHKKIKLGIIYPILFFLEKRVHKYMVHGQEDIPKTWYNSFIKMFYYSFEKGLLDMWVYQHREMNQWHKQKYGTCERYLNDYIVNGKYRASHKYRLFLLKLWITEVMEDTIDREWFNMAALNLAHEMMRFYNVSEEERKKVPQPGEFPTFTSGIELHPKYFVENMNRPVYQNPDLNFRLWDELEQAKNMTKEDKEKCQEKIENLKSKFTPPVTQSEPQNKIEKSKKQLKK